MNLKKQVKKYHKKDMVKRTEAEKDSSNVCVEGIGQIGVGILIKKNRR